MSEEHPPLTIDPSELTPGSVLVISETFDNAIPEVMTNRGVIKSVAHKSGNEKELNASPMELVLTGLGLCLTQSLRMAISQHQMDVPKFAVAISQSRKEDYTKIMCEVIIDAHINEDGRELLKEATNFCPTRKILDVDITVKIIIS